LIKADNL